LEVNTDNKSQVRQGVAVYSCSAVPDGSVNNGIEVVTPALYGQELENTLKNVCKVLKENDCTADNSCGLHIHLNAKDKTENEIKKFFVFYTHFEQFLFMMLPNSRQSNTFCKKVAKSYELDKIKTTKLDHVYYKTTNDYDIARRKRNKYDNARYYALNVHRY
jgi:hypothetical protein